MVLGASRFSYKLLSCFSLHIVICHFALCLLSWIKRATCLLYDSIFIFIWSGCFFIWSHFSGGHRTILLPWCLHMKSCTSAMVNRWPVCRLLVFTPSNFTFGILTPGKPSSGFFNTQQFDTQNKQIAYLGGIYFLNSWGQLHHLTAQQVEGPAHI